MFFNFLVFLSALFLEVIGTWVSVIGLSSIFSGSPVVIVLAICLDFAKLVAVSFLYKYWKSINLLMKSYMTSATLVLMLITSVGAFGFLSKEFQQSISDTNTSAVMIKSMADEQVRLQSRKSEIDSQIAKLPDNMVKGRTALIKQFAPEVEGINTRLVDIDKQLPLLKIETLHKNVEVGPIIYVAQAFNTTPEEAVKWVILIIIFVFDPLAITLLIAGNFLLILRDKKEVVEKVLEPIKETPPVVITPLVPEIIEPKNEIVSVYTEPQHDEDVVISVTPLADAVYGPDLPVVSKVYQEIVPEPEPIVEAVVETPAPIQEVIEPTVEPEVVEPVAEVEQEAVVEPEPEREIIRLNEILNPRIKSTLEDIQTTADVTMAFESHGDMDVLSQYNIK